MAWTFDKRVLAGIGLVVALIVLNAGLTYYNTYQMREDAGWVAHTQEVLELTGDVMRTLVDAESGEGGYLITGKDKFLEPYEQALARLDGQVQTLKYQTRDNQRQQSNIEELEKLIVDELAILREAIDWRRRSREDAELFVASGKGMAKMDEIRQLFAKMEAEEHRLLKEREAKSAASYRVAILTGLITAALGLGLIGLVLQLMRRNLQERNRAAAVLQEQRQWFQVTLASIGDAVITTDTQGRVTFLNPMAAALTGWNQDQAKDQPLEKVFTILHEETRKYVENPVSKVIQQGAIVGLGNHTVLVARDGTERPIDDSAAPIRGDDGKIVGVVLIFRDVTEQRQAQLALRRSEAQLTDDLEAMTRLHDLGNRLLACNDLGAGLDDVLDGAMLACRAEFGNIQLYKPEISALEIAVQRGFKQDFLDYFRLVRMDEGSCCARAMEKGERIIIEDVEVDPTYEAHRAAAAAAGYRGVQSTPLKSRTGSVLGMLSTHFRQPHRPSARDERLLDLYAHLAGDFIERLHFDDALREADRRKDEFLAMLAHELRNPLAPIRNALHMIKRDGTDATNIERMREMMERQVQHMTRMVDDLLDVSRITRGKIELRKQVIELASIVYRTIDTLGPLIEDRQERLTLDLPPNPIRLEADPTRLEQILTNLLNNAVKYTDHGGQVTLTARQEGDQLVLCVKDNGIGIAAAMLPHIFEPFVQSDRVLHHSQGGLGIGLTLVRSLVEMHGGTVTALSGGLGQGSEFVVRLPALSPEQQAPSSPPMASSSESSDREPPRHILVVDDNVDAAESLAMLLRMSGHKVRVAHDGAAALEAIEAETPELVFLDIGMPVMNGYDVAQRLRQTPGHEKLLLVAMTGWGQDEDRRRSQEAGFDVHLVKPVEPSALHELLWAVGRE